MPRKAKHIAVFARDSETITTIGEGYLQDDDVPVNGKGAVCALYERYKIKTRVLKLDSGEIVYGCNCSSFVTKKELDEMAGEGKTIKKKKASDVFVTWNESSDEHDIISDGSLFESMK